MIDVQISLITYTKEIVILVQFVVILVQLYTDLFSAICESFFAVKS